MTAPLSPAPALTAEEAARVAVFDAEEPEEVTVERVARALEESCVVHGRCTWTQLATAALAALRDDRAPLAGQPTTDEEGPR